MKCQGVEFEDDQLTFAEAMALDPSEVEVQSLQGTWLTVDGDPLFWTMAHLRKSKFRRAKPKRSRVQEMAERHYEDTRAGVGMNVYTAETMSVAIRAVCEYLREDFRSPEDVEREFLVPR